LRGRARQRNNNYGGAIEDFTEAIHLQPNNVEYYINRGLTYLMKYNLELGRNDVEAALRISPHNTQAKELLSMAVRQQAQQCYERSQKHYEEGDTQIAIATLDEAISIDPTYAPDLSAVWLLVVFMRPPG
jgi:tetratricopeptide (TPR) repeat protein